MTTDVRLRLSVDDTRKPNLLVIGMKNALREASLGTHEGTLVRA